MWIFMNDAFLSVVADRDDQTLLRVRARCREDLKRVFPDVKIEERVANDYRFVARVERATVAQALAERAMAIDYGNFKSSVKDDERHAAYQRVWGVMYAWGEDLWFALMQRRATRRSTGNTRGVQWRCVCKDFGVRYCPVHGD
jgi:hypothetical protein